MAKMSGSNPPSSAKRSARTSVQPPGARKMSRTASCWPWSISPVIHTVDDRPALVDRHADVEQLARVVPADQLRRHDSGVGPEGLLHQDVDGVGVRGDVVVAEQQQRRPLHHRQDLVGAGPEPPVDREPAHEGAREHRRHHRGGVDGAGRVEDQHRQLGVVLGGEGPQRLLEPFSGVARDDHGDDRRSNGLHQGREATRPLRASPAFLGPDGSVSEPSRVLAIVSTGLYSS